MVEAVPGAESTPSFQAPYLGMVFEGSSIENKARIPNAPGEFTVERVKVEDPDDGIRWALSNFHAYREYCMRTIEWLVAVTDYKMDIETAIEKGKKIPDPARPGQFLRVSLESHERDEAEKTEKIMIAMVAVAASYNCMEQSAGVMDAYVGRLVMNDPDRAETWAEFLLHSDRHKLDILRGGPPEMKIKNPVEREACREKGIPIVAYFWQKLMDDINLDTQDKVKERVARGEAPYKSQMVEYLMDREERYDEATGKYTKGYQKGTKDYAAKFLVGTLSEQERERWLKEFGVDSMMMAAAARLATDIFIVDNFTGWEYGIHLCEEEFLIGKKAAGNLKVGDRLMRLKPSENWGGNPLAQILEPSVLPRHIKGVYTTAVDPKTGEINSAVGEEILDAIDEAFTMAVPASQNEVFRRSLLKPTMTSSLKALWRYGQALWFLYGGDSRAFGLPVWDRKSFDAKEGLPKVIELMAQVVGDSPGVKEGEPVPLTKFGRHAMGWFAERVLRLKTFASLVEIAPTRFRTDMTGPLAEAAGVIAGMDHSFKEGWMRSLSGPRTGFYIDHNIIPEVSAGFIKSVNMLLLQGDYKPESDFWRRSLQIGFAGAENISGSGGKPKKR